MPKCPRETRDPEAASIDIIDWIIIGSLLGMRILQCCNAIACKDGMSSHAFRLLGCTRDWGRLRTSVEAVQIAKNGAFHAQSQLVSILVAMFAGGIDHSLDDRDHVAASHIDIGLPRQIRSQQGCARKL